MGFVSDNEIKMIKMRAILSKQFPSLLTYGCQPHHFNLLEQFISPAEIMEDFVDVNKYYRNHHSPHSKLIEKGGVQPQIPNDTRWNSQFSCIDTFVTNFHIYREVSSEIVSSKSATVQDKRINDLLNKNNAFKNAQTLNNQLTSIGLSLDKV
jgi:hypothetical protein